MLVRSGLAIPRDADMGATISQSSTSCLLHSCCNNNNSDGDDGAVVTEFGCSECGCGDDTDTDNECVGGSDDDGAI